MKSPVTLKGVDSTAKPPAESQPLNPGQTASVTATLPPGATSSSA